MLALTASTLALAAMPSSPAAAAVTIEAPVAPEAGTLNLTGKVGVDPGDVTTVLYVFDATRSTSSPQDMDCSGNGSVGPEDDLNADGNRGDILDCEIAGVKALNSNLAQSSGVQVGLVGFADHAAAADLDPGDGVTPFVAPGFTGGDASPRVETVAESVTRDGIGLYDPRPFGGSGGGTAFNSAIAVALSTLRAAPAGPKWIMLLSDGASGIDKELLGQLSSSEVRLRSFGIGVDASCDPVKSLYKMAAATGESCRQVRNPASLTAGITGSRPDAVNGVSVAIGGVSVAATIDAVGSWRATFTLGAGTYTATATAVLASGVTQRAHRTFTVTEVPGGPRAGTVAAGPGSLRATTVKVAQPRPTRTALPPRVTGRVGLPINGLTVATSLSGTQVLLQVRATAGAPWVTVGRDQVDGLGRFALAWKPQARVGLLQVALRSVGGFAGSTAAVPEPKISSCKVTRRDKAWSVTCQTTAKNASTVHLLRKKNVVDKARVRAGSFHLNGKGKVGVHRIDIKVRERSHIGLAL